MTHTTSIKLLDNLSELTEIVDVTKTIIRKSLKSDFNDFEDAIQYNCAMTINKLDFIVTRDSNDFKKSLLPIMNPEEAIAIINSNQN